MCEKDKLQSVMNTLAAECEALFGDKLSDVRLFGSYARGDYDKESDIDVMIILDMDEAETGKHLRNVCHIAAEIDLEHGVFLSPVLQSRSAYDSRKNLPGFYRNVEREGVSIYGG